MKNNWQHLSVLGIAMAAVGMPAQFAAAQEDDEDDLMEVITTIGSRSAKPRTASDSPVPIDVIDSEQFNALGSTADLTDNMRAMVP